MVQTKMMERTRVWIVPRSSQGDGLCEFEKLEGGELVSRF